MVLYEVAQPLELPVKRDVLSCSRCARDYILLAEQLRVFGLFRELPAVQGSKEGQDKGEAIVPLFIVLVSLP